MERIKLVVLSIVIVIAMVLLSCKKDVAENKPPASHAAVMPSDKADIYLALRNALLHQSRKEINLEAPSSDTTPWGILMEIGFPDGSATLVSLSDGSASLYLSSGGGVIGGSKHEKIRRAARTFVDRAASDQNVFTRTGNYPLPRDGRTIFYLLTDSGVYTAEAREEDLVEERHPLSPLFYAGQNVLTELRLISQGKGKE